MLDLKFDYDGENDVLYISIGSPRPSYGIEESEGIIIRRDFSTHELTGVTILYLTKRLDDIDKLMEKLPFECEIKKEMLFSN